MRKLAIGAALLLAGGLLAACGGGEAGGDTAQPDERPKVTIGIVQGHDFIHAMPPRVAEEQGFFTEEGLDVSIADFSAGSDLTKAMASGSVDIGAATGLDSVAAVAHGVELQTFYGVYADSPMALIVPADSTIASFADLRGKKVGISKAGSLTDYITRAALAAALVPLAEVKEVPLGAPDAVMAGMARGDVDGFVLPVNFAFILEANGTGKVAQTAADAIGETDQFAILMADKAYLESNAETARKVTAAYAKAINWMGEHRDETVSLATTVLGMDAEIAGKTYDAYMDHFTPNGEINKAGLAGYAQALEPLNIATGTPAEESYLNTTVVAGT